MNRVERIAGIESRRSRMVKPAFAPRYGSDELIFFRVCVNLLLFLLKAANFESVRHTCRRR